MSAKPSVELQPRRSLALPWASTMGAIGCTVCAAILWAAALPRVDASRMTDIGLVAALPAQSFAAFVALIVGFCLAISERSLKRPLLLIQVVALVVMLYGTPVLVEEVPRFAVTWRHVGVSEYIMRVGGADPAIDAYFNWPGFFILSAFLTEAAGVGSALSLAGWASVYFNLLYLAPLMLIFRTATASRRLVWLGLWCFYLTNWIGQDYLSPQALNLFFYLAILSVVLRWFKADAAEIGWRLPFVRRHGPLARAVGWLERLLATPDTAGEPLRPYQRAGLLVLLLAVFVASISSHQLTPFFILAAITALVATNRTSLRGMPILMTVLVAAWIRFFAIAYFAGHVEAVTQHVGQVGATVSANVTGRLQGSAGHMLVVYMRLAMSLALWGLAFLGGVRRWRAGSRDLTFALLAVAPFPLMLLQTYGGELLLRAYLFALPFMAFFVAALLCPTATAGVSWRGALAIGVVSAGLLGGFLFTRYGNEKMDHFTSAEIAAIRHVYETSEPGSLMVSVAPNLPWKFQDYEQHKYRYITTEFLDRDVDAIVELMSSDRFPQAYLILSRSQKANVELFYGLQREAWNEREELLFGSGHFQVIFANQDVKVLTLRGRP